MHPYSSAQPFFRDRSVRRRIKAYSTFASLDRGVNVGASKRKLGSRIKLTSFSVHFLFSATCELWRRSRDSISPGWTLGRTLCRRPHSVLAPYPGKPPLPAFRFAARPTSGTTCSRPRKKWSGGRRGCLHRQGTYSSRPHNSSTPGGSGRLPVSSVSVSCGKGSRPACALWAAVVYMGSLSCVPSIFPLPFSPKRLPAPFLRRVPALARSPDFGTFCPEVARCGASPAGVFLFGWSFIFQGAVHR